jgi:hypothetical protein
MLRNKTLKIVAILFWLLAVSHWSLVSFAQEEFVYDAKGKRNPFIPLVTSDGKILNLDSVESNNKGLALEGIIYDKNGISYAIMNGAVVTVGDTVGDIRILKIEKNKVIFIKDGQTSEIQLKEEEEE